VGTPTRMLWQSADTTSRVGTVRVDPADGRLLRWPDDYRQRSLLVSSVCVVQYIFRVAYRPFRAVDDRVPYF
jgi:hypothetical protein